MEILEHGTPEEQSDQGLAIKIGQALEKFYPNHPWVVSFQGNALIIRHLSIAHKVWLDIGQDGFGALLPKDKLTTPKEIARSAIEFGGRLLEAFQLPRGPWDGREPITPASWGYKKTGSFH